jgi:hypothetical protein
MKPLIAGLGMGVIFLFWWAAPLPAFDRDINLPSPNASDPIGLYNPYDGDDVGWDEPVTKGNSDNYQGGNYNWGRISIFLEIYIKHVNFNLQNQPAESQPEVNDYECGSD